MIKCPIEQSSTPQSTTPGHITTESTKEATLGHSLHPQTSHSSKIQLITMRFCEGKQPTLLPMKVQLISSTFKRRRFQLAADSSPRLSDTAYGYYRTTIGYRTTERILLNGLAPVRIGDSSDLVRLCRHSLSMTLSSASVTKASFYRRVSPRPTCRSLPGLWKAKLLSMTQFYDIYYYMKLEAFLHCVHVIYLIHVLYLFYFRGL